VLHRLADSCFLLVYPLVELLQAVKLQASQPSYCKHLNVQLMAQVPSAYADGASGFAAMDADDGPRPPR